MRLYNRVQKFKTSSRFWDPLHHFRRLSHHLTCWLHQTHSTAINKRLHLNYRQLFFEFNCKPCSCVISVRDKKSSLTVPKRAEIVALYEVGLSEREIGKKVHVSKTAVHQDVSKFNISVKYTDLKWSGRPRKTTARDDHVIRKQLHAIKLDFFWLKRVPMLVGVLFQDVWRNILRYYPINPEGNLDLIRKIFNGWS